MNKLALSALGAPGLTLVALSLVSSLQLQGATVYHTGVSPQLTGVFEYGTYLPNHIGATIQDGFGAPITGQREYFYDVNGNLDPATALPFNLVVYSFSTPKDSVRLYPSQDHYGGGPISDSLAPEVMEYSVWGSNTGGPSQSDWTLLSNPIGWTDPTPGNPEYIFAGTSAADIYRGGSFEGGLANAMTQDYTFPTAYKYFGYRGSSIAMAANTADPELDTMVGFNRIDVVSHGAPESTAPASAILALFGLGVLRRRLQTR